MRIPLRVVTKHLVNRRFGILIGNPRPIIVDDFSNAFGEIAETFGSRLGQWTQKDASISSDDFQRGPLRPSKLVPHVLGDNDLAFGGDFRMNGHTGKIRLPPMLSTLRRHRIATAIGALGSWPRMSGEYIASTRVGGRLNRPVPFSRTAYSVTNRPRGTHSK